MSSVRNIVGATVSVAAGGGGVKSRPAAAAAAASSSSVSTRVFPSVLDAIGETPLVSLSRLVSAAGCEGRILAKLDYLNPGGSKKDRVARQIIEEALASGHLKPGQPVVELTSGNTGTGLAIVCAVTGNPFYAVMSRGNSVERARMMGALGANVVLVDQASSGETGRVSGDDLRLVEERTKQLTRELGAFRADQFVLEGSRTAHSQHTGPEFWRQSGGTIDAFVDFVGSGGTFAGCADFFKKQQRQRKPQQQDELVKETGNDNNNNNSSSSSNNDDSVNVTFSAAAAATAAAAAAASSKNSNGIANITKRGGGNGKAVACYVVEPEAVPVLAHPTQDYTGERHEVQGGGYNRGLEQLPIVDPANIDGFLQVSDSEAVKMSRALALQEGLFAGYSAGANVAAALQLLQGAHRGETVACVLCDSGLKYLSTGLWE